jgi:hypothetical protein
LDSAVGDEEESPEGLERELVRLLIRIREDRYFIAVLVLEGR